MLGLTETRRLTFLVFATGEFLHLLFGWASPLRSLLLTEVLEHLWTADKNKKQKTKQNRICVKIRTLYPRQSNQFATQGILTLTMMMMKNIPTMNIKDARSQMELGKRATCPLTRERDVSLTPKQ